MNWEATKAKQQGAACARSQGRNLSMAGQYCHLPSRREEGGQPRGEVVWVPRRAPSSLRASVSPFEQGWGLEHGGGLTHAWAVEQVTSRVPGARGQPWEQQQQEQQQQERDTQRPGRCW